MHNFLMTISLKFSISRKVLLYQHQFFYIPEYCLTNFTNSDNLQFCCSYVLFASSEIIAVLFVGLLFFNFKYTVLQVLISAFQKSHSPTFKKSHTTCKGGYGIGSNVFELVCTDFHFYLYQIPRLYFIFLYHPCVIVMIGNQKLPVEQVISTQTNVICKPFFFSLLFSVCHHLTP